MQSVRATPHDIEAVIRIPVTESLFLLDTEQ